ncbi:hypothetical protein PHLH8_07980 [Pseudomonas sp. Pc102]|uniref:hypothetical protein n=1 Tax=Pseudomonas sp. Pc102 TaxID=2678261 RepID=UPI001BCB1AD0|nr:hypothetical protein [Pseudomonas sp. Pc102]BBP81156.1 hypothetical protein PHLH8_07980 [Pseudomonas sp. Pc102]
MKITQLIPLALSLSVAGCSHAPYVPQEAADLYIKEKITGANAEEKAKNISAIHKDIAHKYAIRSDESAKNRLYNDMISGSLLAGAGVGALTTAHSDLYKSLGALFGLSMGHQLYFNASGQRKIYLLGAEASACTSLSFARLSSELKGITDDSMERVYGSIDANTAEAKSYLYSSEKLEEAVADRTPFAVAAIVNGAVNADRDATATKATLEFIMDLDNSDFQTRKAIYTWLTDEIYRTSFKSEEAFKTIAAFSVNPTDLLNALKPKTEKSGDGDEEKSTEKPLTEDEKEDALLRSRLPRISEIINQNKSCITALPAQPSPT